MENIKVIPVIPSLNPDKKLITYVDELIEVGFRKIIIVNDGSSKEINKIFKHLKKYSECIILTHKINQGKGRALKTAINYYFENKLNNDYLGIITADCDGQHTKDDTLKVSKSLEENKNSLILGTRDFNLENIPFRSRFGNKLTTIIFKLLHGVKINDTQTGLRGVPNGFLFECLDLSGEKYDYEINMLIEAVNKKVDIKEVIIKTIYIDDNKSSHFNPIKDSFKIYKVMFNQFFKYTFSGIISFLIDVLLFYILVNYIFNLTSDLNIILSVVTARVISSLVNFTLNKSLVFNCYEFDKLYFLKYYSLCIIQMMLSAWFTVLLVNTNLLNETILKIVVDTLLFFISYKVQKKYIFKK